MTCLTLMKLFCVKWPTFWRRSTLRLRTGRLAPWFDADCCAARRDCRRLERRYRRTLDAEHRRLWVDAVRQRFRLYRAKKEAYWLSRLEQDGRSLPQLWRSLSSLLGRDSDTTGATGHIADGFAKFFAGKNDDVRTATAGHPKPSVSHTTRSTMSTFQPCTQSDVRRIIMSLPAKSCLLDPVPTFIVRETCCCRSSRAWSTRRCHRAVYQSHRNTPS